MKVPHSQAGLNLSKELAKMIEADKKTENEWAFINKASDMLDSI